VLPADHFIQDTAGSGSALAAVQSLAEDGYLVAFGIPPAFPEQEIFVRSNESARISAGVANRLADPGVIDCVMIEVQSRDYLGENDIVRLEDSYGKV
jgi:hypothetical protein